MKFFLSGLADIEHFHIEVKRFAGEGVIGVDSHFISGYIDDCDNLRPFFAMGLKLHARLHFDVISKVLFRNLEYETFVALAVAFGSGHYAGYAVSRDLALEMLLEAGYYIVVAMEVDERFAAIR